MAEERAPIRGERVKVRGLGLLGRDTNPSNMSGLDEARAQGCCTRD